MHCLLCWLSRELQSRLVFKFLQKYIRWTQEDWKEFNDAREHNEMIENKVINCSL